MNRRRFMKALPGAGIAVAVVAGATMLGESEGIAVSGSDIRIDTADLNTALVLKTDDDGHVIDVIKRPSQ